MVLENLQPKKSKIIKYSKLCRDLNRQYEQNNNADLDNGVYNAFVNEQEAEAEKRANQPQNTPADKENDSSFDDMTELSSSESDKQGPKNDGITSF